MKNFDEHKIREWAEIPNMSFRQMAVKAECSTKTVQSFMKERGIVLKNPCKLSVRAVCSSKPSYAVDVETLGGLASVDGMTLGNMSRILGVSHLSIASQLRRNGISIPKRSQTMKVVVSALVQIGN